MVMPAPCAIMDGRREAAFPCRMASRFWWVYRSSITGRIRGETIGDCLAARGIRGEIGSNGLRQLLVTEESGTRPLA